MMSEGAAQVRVRRRVNAVLQDYLPPTRARYLPCVTEGRKKQGNVEVREARPRSISMSGENIGR